ncbi:nucleoside phosphorylase domain-containing protein [Diplogelasinospora grovesii]|uniref:Nucleoside phosphorylase domain-containing protein n=1 Tax=Diplogelasinospora grovesii TaxID=303347 RepID=A0AAN6N6B7_9PEZI|nr:nucleoside phosphorylase domain-containing protein [Diplogelasinospora grovesii]
MPLIQNSLQRPASRRYFEIAIICALILEADADDDGPLYDKAASDRNAYLTGAISRHNVILTHMPGIGTANAAAVTANCQISFLNIRLMIIVGICGAIPFKLNSAEIMLSNVIISDGVVQYDFQRRLLKRFMRKDMLLNSLSKLNAEIHALLTKLKGRVAHNRLFKATYRYVADKKLCVKCGCNGPLVPRSRLEQNTPPPIMHFGLVALSDTVIKSGEERDTIARFPCVVIKGAYNYADSHKTKVWQRYAAATAAACMKAFLNH